MQLTTNLYRGGVIKPTFIQTLKFMVGYGTR